MPGSRFPSPWSSEEHSAYFVVRDGNGQAISRQAISRQLAHKRPGAADRGEYRQAAGAVAEGLIAALQFRGRITVSIHNALNRVIASRTGKNL
jgi:hypothetical protein